MKNNAHQTFKAVRGLVSQAVTIATVEGTGIDRKGFEEALVILDTDPFTSTTLNVKVQESDALASGYTDITGAAFTARTASDDNKVVVGRLNLVSRKRYIRIVAVGSVGTTGTFSVIVILSEPSEKPVSQVETVEFNVD